MRENYTQIGRLAEDNRIHIDNDWYPRGIPSNVTFAKSVFVDSSYGFAGFHSRQAVGLFIDEASGCYDRSSFFTSSLGEIRIGRFTVLNGTTLICKKHITIGDHCMLAWGSVLTDSWLDASLHSVEARRTLLKKTADDPSRQYPFFGEAKPVVLEDNCWVGFDAVILPGVRLGRGCVVGCKTVVESDVPPYAVITGSPAKIIRYLDANDSDGVRQLAMREFIKKI